MLVTIFQILYYLVLFSMVLMSVFIVFHIVAYSYSATSRIIMLAIFIPVVAVLIFTNFILFSSLPLERFFSGFLLQ